MGTTNKGIAAPSGPKHGGAETSTPITVSPGGTPTVTDLYNDQLPPGGRS